MTSDGDHRDDTRAASRAPFARMRRVLLGGWRPWGWFFVILLGPPIFAELTREAFVSVEVQAPRAGSYRAFLRDNGYHATLIVENPDRRPLGPPENPRAAWIEYAWGDRRFYMESRFWPWDIAATTLWPTESVVYIRGRASPPSADEASEIALDAKAWQQLVSSLEGSIHRERKDRAPAHPRRAGYSGRFYPARGRYLWSDNCNRWVVDRLRAARLASGGLGVVVPAQAHAALAGE